MHISFPGASNGAIGFNNTDTGSASQGVLFFNRNGILVGNVSVTNTNTSYNTSSDKRLKENIKPLNNADAIIDGLNPVTFD